ncbi:MAG: bacterial transcriptional activator domain-containing protein, partial [Anaerolineales bacterium]|nr:bacterial transcriptional activator domain-containing protein [Anaerolineales bacterium]
ELAQGQYQACINNCQNLLDIEPCQETAYQLSMQAYAKQSDRIGLIRIYNSCKENLATYLGIYPSENINKTYEDLLN